MDETCTSPCPGPAAHLVHGGLEDLLQVIQIVVTRRAVSTVSFWCCTLNNYTWYDFILTGCVFFVAQTLVMCLSLVYLGDAFVTLPIFSGCQRVKLPRRGAPSNAKHRNQ